MKPQQFQIFWDGFAPSFVHTQTILAECQPDVLEILRQYAALLVKLQKDLNSRNINF